MKNKKKYSIVFLLLSFIGALAIAIYFRSDSTAFYLRNDSGLGKVPMELWVEGKSVFKGDVEDFYIPDTCFAIPTKFGVQTLTLESGDYKYSETFIPGIDKFILLDFGDFNAQENMEFSILKSWSPIMFQ